MRFSKSGNTYQVSRITGPSHNLLRVELRSARGVSSPDIELLPAISGGKGSGLSSEVVMHQVLSGVNRANVRFGKDFSVIKIYYIPDDTYSDEVYEFLAESIIEHISIDGAFRSLLEN